MKPYVIKSECRICKGRKLIPVLDLGRTPPANNFLSVGELAKPEPRFPLAIQFCSSCTLVSLRHVVDPIILFKNYRYLTSASAPLVAHFKTLADTIKDTALSGTDDLVVEFGSNDGVLLGALKGFCRVLGVDPAKSVRALAKARGVNTVTDFFGERSATSIRKTYGEAKVIVANNVFAHIDDLDDVMCGVNVLLRSDGVFISESHWVGNLIGKGGFDQIYHEHLSYYSLHALVHLALRFNLTIIDAKLVPIHGESLRITMAKTGTPSSAVRTLLAKEKKLGITQVSAFRTFGKQVIQNRKELISLLQHLIKEGKTVMGYGAPAKGNTLLNYFHISPRELLCITDTTPLKQGLFTPGAHIPVVSPNILKQSPPDYLLLLSWNYATEILKKERALRKQGVKFILPVPQVRVV